MTRGIIFIIRLYAAYPPFSCKSIYLSTSAALQFNPVFLQSR
jgi:hypothetical protein